MQDRKYLSYDKLCLYDERIKEYISDNFAKADEPIFTGDIIVDGEIKASNVPHTISESILCTIPASTIQECIDSGVNNITIDSFEFRDDLIV